MIQLQVINKLLTDRNFSLLTNNNIDEKYFSQYSEEYKFIRDHYKKYGNVPDDETIAEKFEDFEFIDVTESDKYLIEALQEEYLYNEAVPILTRAAEMLQSDSKQAVEYLLPSLRDLNQTIVSNVGVDIMSAQGIQARKEKYEQYKEGVNVDTISTGFKELDEIIGGWYPGEELVMILGRINQGKSWLLQAFLANAWANGKSVLLYSGEMSSLSVGFRTDTLVNHYSNRGLTSGNIPEEDAYFADLDRCKDFKIPFRVVTPKDLGGRLNVEQLRDLIIKHNPDIIGIDQLSLMNDTRRSRDRNEKYTNISEDLYDLSEELGKPILFDHQANRGAAFKDEDGNMDTPEIEHSKDSDGPAASATRIISLAQTGAGLKISVKKNRYGANNLSVTYFWDIDKGTFTYLPESSDKIKAKDSPTVKNLKAKNKRKVKENSDSYVEGTDVF